MEALFSLQSKWLGARNADFLLSLLIGVCSASVLAAAAFMLIRKREGQPPGPRGLPIIGHLHMLGSLPHQTLAHLSKSYGPLISLRLGSLPLLVASSSDMAKLILHTHDKVFSGRPQNLSVPNIAFNCLDIAYCSLGPYWKLMRQLCFTEFFSMKRIDYFQRMREEEVCGLIRSILTAQGAPISIREKLHETNCSNDSRETPAGARRGEQGSSQNDGIVLDVWSGKRGRLHAVVGLDGPAGLGQKKQEGRTLSKLYVATAY